VTTAGLKSSVNSQFQKLQAEAMASISAFEGKIK